ncbi:hypothetical protein M513_03932 [Trichuris suis]|nr:hypothetical protein M513_03932 [Trichuris suis]
MKLIPGQCTQKRSLTSSLDLRLRDDVSHPMYVRSGEYRRTAKALNLPGRESNPGRPRDRREYSTILPRTVVREYTANSAKRTLPFQ